MYARNMNGKGNFGEVSDGNEEGDLSHKVAKNLASSVLWKVLVSNKTGYLIEVISFLISLSLRPQGLPRTAPACSRPQGLTDSLGSWGCCSPSRAPLPSAA